VTVRFGLRSFSSNLQGILCQSIDLVGVIRVVGVTFLGMVWSRFALCYEGLGGLVFVVLAVVFVRAGELFEEVGILDGGGDFVVAGGPFAEVEDTAAVGAEGEVFVGDEDDFATGGAEECFWCGHGVTDCKSVRGAVALDDGLALDGEPDLD
jgi:hypothetical protein